MKRVKFVYTTEVDLSIENGQGINEREFITALLEDYSDQVICITPYPRYPNNYFNSKIQYVFPYQSSAIRYPFFLASLFLKLLKLSRVKHLKAFIFRLGEVPIVPLILTLITQKPLFLKTLAGYYLFEKKNRHWTRRVHATLALPIYRAVIKRAHVADTVSFPYIEWLSFKLDISRDKLCVIPNGANMETFSPRDRDNCKRELGIDRFHKIVGYVGALDSVRHLEDLINSMCNVKIDAKVGLLLVGDGSHRNMLVALVQKLKLEKNVIFTGVVPYQDVPKYMNAFDIGIDLSLVPMRVNNNILYASYSQKIPQYLSCGLPVIAWDTPDTQFLKQEQIGDVVSLGNIDGLAQSIKRQFAMNDLKYAQQCLRAREYANKHFSSKALAALRFAFWQSASATQS
ncbi:MAG: glycosyltransferase [Candidatus Scalindua rubra]|nr:glycosyltransferase [Candidatus Scalindua rubra]